MRPARVLLLSCCVALGLAGRAHALFDDDEARRRIEVLRSDVSANQKQVQEQLKRIEAAVQDRSTLIDLAGQIDALRQEITRLNGQAEVLMNRADGTSALFGYVPMKPWNPAIADW